jgi:hypothetical protein
MKRFGFALWAVLALVAAGRAEAKGIAGAWTAVQKDDPSSGLQFHLNLDGDGNIGRGFKRSDFVGLTPEAVAAQYKTPVTFELRREAGTVKFDGTFRSGRGAGDFTFVPDFTYARKLREMGVAFDAERGGEAERLFQLATMDVSTDFIRSMRDIGYKESLDQYIAFRIFKVDPAYVREMSGLGFRGLSAERLVETKVHGATPEYIRDMRAHGEDLSLEDYIQSRIFQVTPEFANEMKKLGYPNLDHDQMVAFRVHGVTPEFVGELKQLGYKNVTADDLVAMRVHGVTPDFIRKADNAAGRKVPVDRLIEMRIFGRDPEDSEDD